MGVDLREERRMSFQGFLESLHQEPGCTVLISHAGGESSMTSFSAGMRVLSATPLFSRATGEIERWRHWLLFAEMAILDTYGGGHPVHCFECEVDEQQSYYVKLKDLSGTYEFLVCRNDPHEDDERQAAVYQEWAVAVKDFGGETALKALLDSQAEQWTRDLLATGEMKP